VRGERSPRRGLGRWEQTTKDRNQDVRLVSVAMFSPEDGKAFLCQWGRWARFDEPLDGLAGRWSIGHTSRGIVLLCLADDRVRLDVVESFEEAIARGWPATLWAGVKRPGPPDAHVVPLPVVSPDPPRYHMPALRVLDDDLSADAIAAVRRAGRGSVSMLQRELSIGHARAGRIIDLMERAGIVGPPGPSGVRQLGTGNALDSDQ
jgi:hypothetical protein